MVYRGMPADKKKVLIWMQRAGDGEDRGDDRLRRYPGSRRRLQVPAIHPEHPLRYCGSRTGRPLPGSPLSSMVMPVTARTSRTRKSRQPVPFPYPRSKIFTFSPAGMPAPLSSTVMTAPGPSLRRVMRISVAPLPYRKVLSIRLESALPRRGSAYTAASPLSQVIRIAVASNSSLTRETVFFRCCQRGGSVARFW